MGSIIVKNGRVGIVAGRVVTDAGGADCCCGPGGWIRAVACNPSTVPQVIVAAVSADGRAEPGSLCAAASGCPVAGGLIVLYAGRCYTIEASGTALPPGCALPGHPFAARVYADRPDGVDVGAFSCLGSGADCSDPRCALPPPIGCCVEFISYDCAGNQRRCEGGQDVTWTRDIVTETIDINQGFRTLRRFTEHLVMRARCVANSIVTTIDPQSFQENHLERTGFPDSTSRIPITFVPAGTFRTPGNTPLAADGSPPPPCVVNITQGTYRETALIVTGCTAGTYTRDISDVGHTQTDRWAWRWDVSIPCNRGGGILPLGIDPTTLRPYKTGCPSCGE